MRPEAASSCEAITAVPAASAKVRSNTPSPLVVQLRRPLVRQKPREQADGTEGEPDGEAAE